MAIQSRLPSCDLFSCAGKIQKVEELREKFGKNWRLVPGLASLVCCVIAVAYSIFWDAPFLCVSSATGGFSALYLIILAIDYQNLKDLGEYNQELKRSIGNLELQNDNLEAKLVVFEAENTRIKASADQLEKVIVELQGENINLKEVVKDLQGVNTTLKETAGAHVGDLKKLADQLLPIEQSAKDNLSVLAVNVDKFVGLNKSLQRTQEQVESADQKVVAMNSDLDEMKSGLLVITRVLEGIFNQVKDLQDEKSVQERATLLRILNEQCAALRKEYSEVSIFLGDLKGEVGRRQGQLDQQEEQIKEFKGIISENRAFLGQLKEHAETLKETKDGFLSGVKKMLELAQRHEFN